MVNENTLEALRSLAKSGATVPAMLRWIIQDAEPDSVSHLDLIQRIKMAFCLALADAAPIGGWDVDGLGELSDERIQSLIYPKILATQSRWDKSVDDLSRD